MLAAIASINRGERKYHCQALFPKNYTCGWNTTCIVLWKTVFGISCSFSNQSFSIMNYKYIKTTIKVICVLISIIDQLKSCCGIPENTFWSGILNVFLLYQWRIFIAQVEMRGLPNVSQTSIDNVT